MNSDILFFDGEEQQNRSKAAEADQTEQSKQNKIIHKSKHAA